MVFSLTLPSRPPNGLKTPSKLNSKAAFKAAFLYLSHSRHELIPPLTSLLVQIKII